LACAHPVTDWRRWTILLRENVGGTSGGGTLRTLVAQRTAHLIAYNLRYAVKAGGVC